VNAAIEWSTPKAGQPGQAILQGANYYWFFALTMLASAVIFVIAIQFYRGKTYIQGAQPQASEA
jgi:hypothetical protein